RGFDQPMQHRVRLDFKDPRGRPYAEPLRQAGQDTHAQLDCRLLAMKNCAMMLRKIPLARGALEWPPKAAIGMPVGSQVVHPQPAAIATAVMGTKVHRSIHGTRAAVRGGHRIGPDRRRWMGLPGLLFTQRTVRLVRQARERFGLGGTL